jgi:molybdopterin/thiamine biosynthesis adenylyltransferase
MSSPPVEVADVVDALKAHGFTYLGAGQGGWLRFSGELKAAGGAHACELEVDSALHEVPRVRLNQLPSTLPSVLPHLGAAGQLCYLATGSVVFDMFDPVGQTLACITQAEHVLDSVLGGKLVKDLEDEFFAFWGGPFCLVDLQGAKLGRQEAYLASPGTTILGVVTDDKDRTLAKLKPLGWAPTEKPFLAIRVRTAAKPRPDQRNWPPSTVQHLLQWQNKLDPRCRKKIESRLQAAFDAGNRHALVLIESPLLTYGFESFFERPPAPRRPKKSARQRLLEQAVTPLSVVRIDDRYMAERNSPGGRTLAGLSIAVVGCGTIGGYLADMLVKAGAGTSGGKLMLVDPDLLGPNNLGRHRLGFPDLFKNKAAQLREELRRGAPGASVTALPVDIRGAELGQVDLLIDATGEEALGHWLTWRYAKASPILSVWVEGAGLAVRALLRAKPGGACHRCMSDYVRSGQFMVLDAPTPTVMKGHGCEGLYVPFPATVSVQAASLAVEMVQAWANGATEPALRTRLLETGRTLATADCSPPVRPGCPACSS